jgi:hypothetical protein
LVFKLILPRLGLAMIAVCVVAGCGQSEEAKNSYLDAPMTKKSASKADFARERGMSPEAAATIDRRPGATGGRR